jgi:adenosylcobinamide-GDP ribazoletransferase
MFEAFAFLTVAGRDRAPTSRAVPWFPVVGALVGTIVALVWWGANSWWTAAVAASLAVVADLVLTGMLHYDGLADSADGLLPHLDRPRRLAVMSQPDIGAFGVVVVAIVLLLRTVTIAALDTGWSTVGLMAMLWANSRLVMAVGLVHLPYARSSGLASSFKGTNRSRMAPPWVVAIAASAVALWIVDGNARAAASLGAAIMAGALILGLSQRRIGGFTGDALGAAGLVSETVGLLVASAHW